MILDREIEAKIKQISSTFPALMITGPRQVGKTTTLKKLAEGREYITFDNLLIREIADKDPALFLQQHSGKLLIDEIQYAPKILSYIKIDIDNNKEYGKFWLTGSQQFHLMKNISESLAGRIGILDLRGFSQREKLNDLREEPFLPSEEYFLKYKRSKNLQIGETYDMILRGSFPEVSVNRNLQLKDFYSAYLKTYIERDVRELINISNENTFLRFIQILASLTGQILNYSNISRDIGVSVSAIKNWISILESSRLIYLLQPYYVNIGSRTVKSPKIYFLDTGLCAYLCGWQTRETLELGAMSGAIFETYVVSEILKSYWHNGEEPKIYFYRNNNQREIDIILERNGKLYPVEIKKTASPRIDDIKHFKVLPNYECGCIICLCQEQILLAEKTSAINVGMI
jgi:predicted AAA+ superfamily ATPase